MLAAWRTIPRRERALLAAIAIAGLALRVAYVLVTKDHALAGDEIDYDTQGRLWADGHLFWSDRPYGDPHPSMWKAPGYPAWVGTLYAVLGTDPDRVLLVQALLGPVTIVLTWLLGRRLFGPAVGLGAAAAVALLPNAWQFEVRLYSEALATPLTLLVLLVVLERPATLHRALLAGAVVGLSLYVRPTMMILLAGAAVAWWTAAGLRRGALLTAAAVACAAVVIAPWTIRNYDLSGGFVPISVQDAAAYGVFNDEAAADPVYPFAWRPLPKGYEDLFVTGPRLSELELRAELQRRAREWALEHPEAIPKAFFWNGIVRLWDLRRPARVLDEVAFEGRTRAVTAAGLAGWWVVLPLALAGMWRARRRRGLVLPVLAICAAAAVVYTTDSGTRYRAPLEPVFAIFAASALVRPLDRAGRRLGLEAAPGPGSADDDGAGPDGARVAGPVERLDADGHERAREAR